MILFKIEVEIFLEQEEVCENLNFSTGHLYKFKFSQILLGDKNATSLCSKIISTLYQQTLIPLLFLILDDALKVDEEKRVRIKQLRSQFDELVYEYVTDTEDASVEDNLDKKDVISEGNLCLELHNALSIGLERLGLMDELRIKVRSRLDFVLELYECAAYLNIS